MSYVIETGVPIPVGRGFGSKIGPRTPLTQHLDILEPGQSLLVQEYREYKAAEQFATRSKPRLFVFRKMRDGWRVWRVE